MRSKILLIAGALALASVYVACGNDGSDVGAGTEEAPRTVEITALDELAYDPISIEIEAGETVRFVVTNEGAADHEFVVGDVRTQEMAEEQAMEGMHGHMDAMASLALDPGETVETTITFEDAGELFYACHLDGHYGGGMIGTINVS